MRTRGSCYPLLFSDMRILRSLVTRRVPRIPALTQRSPSATSRHLPPPPATSHLLCKPNVWPQSKSKEPVQSPSDLCDKKGAKGKPKATAGRHFAPRSFDNLNGD